MAGDEFFKDEKSRIRTRAKPLKKTGKLLKSKQKLMDNGNSRYYQSIMSKLKYLKKMRNTEKISELEYQRKKEILLESF